MAHGERGNGAVADQRARAAGNSASVFLLSHLGKMRRLPAGRHDFQRNPQAEHLGEALQRLDGRIVFGELQAGHDGGTYAEWRR